MADWSALTRRWRWAGSTCSVWQANQHRGARLVNQPGTWVFSDLYTRDLDAAKAFYGAVFGWEVSSVEFDGGAFHMWPLPGYGDFLEQRDPDLRRRLADGEAPDGFEDVVAGLVPMTSEQFPDDVPPHWAVQFATGDTDATAELAATLGGRVAVPPFDAGPTRVAVLSDPQGAQFSVSKYTPG